ncbi:MAG: hypothetical protein KatS3mg131_1109 [Candidatus Tectimicrobiota bacterium]|nr:MAG: hypothetical protein KatS3mg131_1109 [Candidatus Tectomicrobia bacterium]
MGEEVLLRVDNLTKAFGGVVAVNRCSLSIAPRRIYGLIGPNGSGKTTLFDLITGIQRPDSGEVYFRGERLTHLKPYQIARRGISRTFQIIRVFPEMTALENLLVVAPRNGAAARGPAPWSCSSLSTCCRCATSTPATSPTGSRSFWSSCAPSCSSPSSSCSTSRPPG